MTRACALFYVRPEADGIVKLNSDMIYHFRRIRVFLHRGNSIEGTRILQLNTTHLQLVLLSFAAWIRAVISIEDYREGLTTGISAMSYNMEHVV